MQAAAALMEPGPELEMMVPVERLPDEVLELLFRFVEPKTLLMVVPAVSARGGRQRGGVATPSSRSAAARGGDALRASGLDWRERL